MPQPLTIRRAAPLDVVNLYRLVTEQGEINPFDPSDVAGALRRVLDAIQNGYVLVVHNKARRLAAALICEGQTLPSGALVCEVTGFAVVPPYRDSHIAADLLDLAVRSADRIPVIVPLSPQGLLAEAAKNSGFKPAKQYWVWKKNKNDHSPRRSNEAGAAATD